MIYHHHHHGPRYDVPFAFKSPLGKIYAICGAVIFILILIVIIVVCIKAESSHPQSQPQPQSPEKQSFRRYRRW